MVCQRFVCSATGIGLKCDIRKNFDTNEYPKIFVIWENITINSVFLGSPSLSKNNFSGLTPHNKFIHLSIFVEAMNGISKHLKGRSGPRVSDVF